MTKRMIFPILLGVIGVTILVMLGNWQLQRLQWKTQMLANIEQRLNAEPVELPAALNPEQDRFLSVKVSGIMEAGEIHVLSSDPGTGAGYRIISPFVTTDGRRILIDRGIVPTRLKNAERLLEHGTLFGNLLWAADTDKYSPDADIDKNIWFSREVGPLAQALQTEEIFLVLNQTDFANGPKPVSVGLNTPNNHLEYVLTWYGFAIVWGFMTLYLLWRIKRRTV